MILAHHEVLLVVEAGVVVGAASIVPAVRSLLGSLVPRAPARLRRRSEDRAGVRSDGC